MFSVAKRKLTGESVFMTHFTNEEAGKRRVAFAAPYPGKILPVDLAAIPGNELICQKDAFLCAARGTKISVTFHKRLGAGFFGGEGFVLQKLTGDGMVFIHAGGTMVEKRLENQKIRIDSGCIVGFSSGIDYSVELAGGLKSMFFGGEGVVLATLSGTGFIYLQSLPFSRLADRIIQAIPFPKDEE
jgi:uncharacterized protein (TIGR00266 family)